MVLPQREECLEWLKELKMPENIVEHTLQVNRVAVFVAKKLKEKGVKVDVELVDRASLIHDIDKHLTFENKRHGFEGKKILEKKGFRELGEFCVSHLLTFVLDNELPSIEHKIVYYADKRVNGEKIVPLKERFAYFENRYGSKEKMVLKRILKTKPICKKLEEELFDQIEISLDLSDLNG